MSGAICYSKPTSVTVAMGTVLIVGTLLSYVPWFVTLLRRKSSEGVSVLTLASGLLSGSLNLINASILNWDKLICCGSTNPSLCWQNNIVIEQLCVGPGCVLGVFALVLFFFDTSAVSNDVTRTRAKLRAYRLAWIAFVGTLALSFIACTVALSLYYGGVVSGPWVIAYAKWVGISSALLTLLQWSPQIVLSWRSQDAGAMSLGTLCLQLPGNVLVVIFQLSAPKSHWTSWAPYIVSSAQQLVLIALLLYFQCAARGKRKEKVEDEDKTLTLLEEDPDEDLISLLARLWKSARPVNEPRNTLMQ